MRNSLRATLFLVSALSASAASAAAEDKKDPDSVNVIIVTAQKRSEAITEVPLSLDVISDERLDNARAGAQDLLFLAARSPSLYAESSSGRIFPRFYIRGLGNTDFDLNANGPVSVVLDEVPLENAILRGFPLFDVDRVEVLRGPQGTLFGRNTPAGVVKIETVKANAANRNFARVSLSRFDTIDAEGAVGGDIGGGFSLRVSGLYQRRDDFVDNTFAGGGERGFEEFRDVAGRVQLGFDRGGRFNANLSVFGRDLSGGSRLFRANIIEPGRGGLVDGFDRFSTAQDATQLLESDTFGAILQTNTQIGDFTLSGVSSYSEVRLDARGDVDGGFGADFAPPSGPGFIPFAAESADNITGHSQRTSELRLSGPVTDDIDVTVGGFYFRERLQIENESFDTLSGGTRNGLAVQDQRTTAYALFGSATVSVIDRLKVTAGLRFSREEKDFTASRLVGPFGAPPLGPVTRSLRDSNLSGDVSLRYDLSDTVNFYARYARGFRAPNVQGRIVFGDAVTVADTETNDSFEAGVKGTFLDGKGRFNATAFYYVTDDQQLTAVGGAGNFNQLLNADHVRGHGFELDLGLDPVERLSLTAGLSLNNTRIDDPTLEVGVCGAACTVLDPINPATGNALIDGNPLPQAPRWIANGTASYTIPLGSGEVFTTADFAYRSNINFFLYESAEFRDRSLFELGARIGYRLNDNGFEISAFGRNILGDTSVLGAIDFNNFAGFVNEPAVYGIELKKLF
ncbi:TonB-dependent receptor domain-containing protein [Erythrobacter sp.]|uniref:TonB-dependent receptor n=1 Tax=Erythrobacter sp. TaxID=1042 RepID=UPI00311DCF66